MVRKKLDLNLNLYVKNKDLYLTTAAEKSYELLANKRKVCFTNKACVNSCFILRNKLAEGKIPADITGDF